MSSNCRGRNSREIHIVLPVLREEQKGGIHESCTLVSASRGLAAAVQPMDLFALLQLAHYSLLSVVDARAKKIVAQPAVSGQGL
jgi:hypothetical protein